jgi:transposase
MKPYSEDLRTRIVKALQEEGGMSKPEAARLFEDVSLSSVKRYARGSLVEGPLSNQEGEAAGPRKGGPETTQRLLEEDVHTQTPGGHRL